MEINFDCTKTSKSNQKIKSYLMLGKVTDMLQFCQHCEFLDLIYEFALNLYSKISIY